MKKTIDINSEKLEKETFTTMCGVFEGLCIAFTVILGVITLGIVIVLSALGAKTADIITISVNSGILLFGMGSAVNFGRAIFKKLHSGESPFRYDIADKIKGASYALIISGLASMLINPILGIFSTAFSDICYYFIFIMFGNIFIGFLLYIVAYVMNYGCKLQQESDETL